MVNHLLQVLRQAKAVRLPYGDVSDVFVKEGGDFLLNLVKEKK